jgi:hypothetical protein
MSDLSPHDAEQRAFVLGFSIAFYYAVGKSLSFSITWRQLMWLGAWSNVLIWPASQVPHYRVAWQCSIALWALVIILLCALRWTELKYIRLVHVAYCNGILLLMTNRPRNRRIAEEKYDAADSQLPDKDLDDKQDVFARVVSAGSYGRQ